MLVTDGTDDVLLLPRKGEEGDGEQEGGMTGVAKGALAGHVNARQGYHGI